MSGVDHGATERNGIGIETEQDADHAYLVSLRRRSGIRFSGLQHPAVLGEEVKARLQDDHQTEPEVHRTSPPSGSGSYSPSAERQSGAIY